MVLNSSGSISFSDIQSELGGKKPISLSEYYQNASSGYAVGIRGVSNKGSAIALNQFRGKKKSVLKTVTLQTSSFSAPGAYNKQSEYSAPSIKLPNDYQLAKKWNIKVYVTKNNSGNTLSKFYFGFKNASGRNLQGVTVNGTEGHGYGGYRMSTNDFIRSFNIGSAGSTIQFYLRFYGFANLTNCYFTMYLEYYA